MATVDDVKEYMPTTNLWCDGQYLKVGVPVFLQLTTEVAGMLGNGYLLKRGADGTFGRAPATEPACCGG